MSAATKPRRKGGQGGIVCGVEARQLPSGGSVSSLGRSSRRRDRDRPKREQGGRQQHADRDAGQRLKAQQARTDAARKTATSGMPASRVGRDPSSPRASSARRQETRRTRRENRNRRAYRGIAHSRIAARSAATGKPQSPMPANGLSTVSASNGFISCTCASQIGHTAGSIMRVGPAQAARLDPEEERHRTAAGERHCMQRTRASSLANRAASARPEPPITARASQLIAMASHARASSDPVRRRSKNPASELAASASP